MVETLSKEETKVHNWRAREQIQAFRLLFPRTRKLKLTVPPNPVSPIVPVSHRNISDYSFETLCPPLDSSLLRFRVG